MTNRSETIVLLNQMTVAEKKKIQTLLRELHGPSHVSLLAKKSGMTRAAIYTWFRRDGGNSKIEPAIIELIDEVKERRQKLKDLLKST